MLNSLNTLATPLFRMVEEDPETVATANTSALWSFIVIGLLAVLVIVLIMDMARRMRRTRYREQIRRELEAEIAAASAADAADLPDASGDPSN